MFGQRSGERGQAQELGQAGEQNNSTKTHPFLP
jgi:hypothetical protein